MKAHTEAAATAAVPEEALQAMGKDGTRFVREAVRRSLQQAQQQQ
ncbi:hypothetical protein [Synechococcus sp. KORDI-100]|nr:hypothetical protein [Synechococcus sp. KORDI-100]